MTGIREIGIPVRSVNRAMLYPGRDAGGDTRIIATMSQQAAGFFLLVIDPRTGAFRQIDCPNETANYTTAAYMSRDGNLYIGAAHTGELYRWDPDRDELIGYGTIGPQGTIFPCRIDEDSAGRIWISSYATADLTCFDPATESFTRYGRMDDTDMYAYCFVNRDDTIAVYIKQTKPHVVVFDPKTGEKRTTGPVVHRDSGSLELYRGVDGLLYIDSTEGQFRVDGFDATPVTELPPPEPPRRSFADGTSFQYLDAKEHEHRTLEVRPPGAEPRVFRLDYEAAGTDIFCLHAGPDGKVYGSSVLPERFFRYDPGKDEMIDFGICSQASGEAYSMANLDGLIYIASYPGARVSVYDPAAPYDFGGEADSNPRDLGRIDNVSYRPRSTIAGPGGKVWFASLPDYGLWGGPLGCYDPAAAKFRSFKGICGEASCYTLASLGDDEPILVGTTIQGGSGTKPRAERATLFLFDHQAERTVWEGEPPGRRATAFTSLLPVSDRTVVGVFRTGDGEYLFLFDVPTRRFAAVVAAPPGGVRDNGLARSGDRLFALTRSGIYEIDLTDLVATERAALDGTASDHVVCGPIIAGQLYFGIGHRLFARRIE